MDEMNDTGVTTPTSLESAVAALAENHVVEHDADPSKAMPPIPQSGRSNFLLIAGASIAVALAWGLWRSDRAVSLELSFRRQRSSQIAADAARIMDLRMLPVAVNQSDSSETWLLERVTSAMSAAGISPEHLVSTAPQPLRPKDGIDVAEATQTLELENVSLEELTRFSISLGNSKPLVRVSELQLRTRPGGTTWNVEVGVSCLTTSSQSGARPRMR